MKISIDWNHPTGPVKPVNGVGQPPMIDPLGKAPLFRYLKDAGVPYSRLHDVGGWLGGGMYVDIPNLFPDFDADEADPANYRFDFTDALLRNLEKNGVEPFFRLGITIENFVEGGFKPVRCNPPKDFAKWARICEHVIRHYTEGWADGFRMNIAYWEIWNEPENNPVLSRNPMWSGTFEEYMELYGVAATHLKKCFPHLKIGGYGHCGFYAAVGAGQVKAANSSPRMEYFVECSHKFLRKVRDNHWPLDFLSFHSYSEPVEAMRQVRFARAHLDEYGFQATELCFNEWLPKPDVKALGTARQAALVAAELIGLQYSPCDNAMIYDARCGVGAYSPLFNPLTQEPHKAYYAFVAFHELRKLGTAVEVRSEGAEDRVWAAAAAKDGRRVLMVANMGDAAEPLLLDAWAGAICRITDAAHTYETCDLPLELPPESILLIC